MAKKRKTPDRKTYRLERRGGELSARWRTGRSGIGRFMLIWMSGWTVGCCLLTYVASTQRSVEAVVVAGVFWCGWLLGFQVFVRQWFGRESLHLSAEGVRTTASALLRRTQTAPLHEIITFCTYRGPETNDEQQRQLEVRTVGRPWRLGDGLTDGDVAQLADELRTVLGDLRESHRVRNGYPKEAETVVFRDRIPGELLGGPINSDRTEVRTSSDLPIELPSDSRLMHRDDFDATTVWRRGRFHPTGVLATLVIVGFWIGIVSMFVRELWFAPENERPVGIEWIWKFVFLIPFEVIGVALAFGVLLLALEPFRVWTRRFTPHEVIDRLAWFGVVRFQKRHSVAGVDRIEVRRVPYGTVTFPKRLPLASLWAPAGCPTYDLVPVDTAGKEICRVEGLSFGEACWMADTLLRTRGDWFRR